MLKRLFFIFSLFLSIFVCVPTHASEEKCLASAIYRESNGEPLDGQIAVAGVVLNRVAHSRYPNTICGNISARGQFPWYHKKGLKYTESSLALARRLMYKKGSYYHVISPNVIYFNHKNSRGFSKGKRHYRTIGNHAFYTDRS